MTGFADLILDIFKVELAFPFNRPLYGDIDNRCFQNNLELSRNISILT